MSNERDPRVDDYIGQAPEWQQEICQRVRELILGADPEVEETVKRTIQPYYVLQGNICALQTTKNHVNVFLYCGGIVPDPHGIVTDGHGGSTGRQIKIRQNEPINEKALVEMFQRIIADNRAGGWRKIKAERGLD